MSASASEVVRKTVGMSFKLAFPLIGTMQDVYVPQSTILRMLDDSQTHAYLWCYLKRKAHGTRYLFNPRTVLPVTMIR